MENLFGILIFILIIVAIILFSLYENNKFKNIAKEEKISGELYIICMELLYKLNDIDGIKDINGVSLYDIGINIARRKKAFLIQSIFDILDKFNVSGNSIYVIEFDNEHYLNFYKENIIGTQYKFDLNYLDNNQLKFYFSIITEAKKLNNNKL